MANEQNLKPFKKGQSGNPKGRPVKLFSELAAEWQARGIERATPQRVVETFEYLLALPKEELLEMAKSEGQNSVPSIIQMAAEEMTGKRKREILADMLDRAHGKATQKIESNTKVEIGLNFENLSDSELKTLLALTEKAQAAGENETDNE